MALYRRILTFILYCGFLAACTVIEPVAGGALPAGLTTTGMPLDTNTHTPSPSATRTSTPSSTVTPDQRLTVDAYERTLQTDRPNTEQIQQTTNAVEYDQTSTSIVQAIQVTVTPRLFQEFQSPDGNWKAQVILYDCAQITTEEGYTHSYEVLKIIHTPDGDEQVVDRQLLYCGGVGAGGLGGLLWSTNSRFFYYTTAREGVPDGTGGFGFMRPVSRFDVTSGKSEGVGCAFSPDQTLIAGGQGTDLVVWKTDGDEIARFPGPKVEQGWINYLAWSPDGERVAYLLQVPDMDSTVMIVDVKTGETVQAPWVGGEQMWEVRWIDTNRLWMASFPNFKQWQFDLVTGQVNALETATPPVNDAAFPTPTPQPSPSPTLTPTVSGPLFQSFCDGLSSSHQPPVGYRTYCDSDYGIAFDYPSYWRITTVAQTPDVDKFSPILVRRAARFEAPDMSNYIRVDTYRVAMGSLADKVQNNDSLYPYRTFKDKDYPSLAIGGRRAYAIIVPWQQDYSAVYIFFEHGGRYYSILELKAIDRHGLETNWAIARSIQIPGSKPEDNVIPDDLVTDSFTLIP